MARYQVILAYDGSLFKGFQRQARARSVQGEVEKALRQIGWNGRAILSAGRTDTGVHAAGQVIAFDLEWGHSDQELLLALNANLPEDVAARAVRRAADDFHPRYDALSRTYRYRLFCAGVRDPLRERHAWRVWPAVELELLQAAAGLLPGMHDFAAFGTPPRPGGSTVRTVQQALWRRDGSELILEITANAFLYHMARRLTFVLVQAGQGNVTRDEIAAGLNTGQTQVPGLAPAHGLTLMRVEYPAAAGVDDLMMDADLDNKLAVRGDDDRGQDLRP